MPTLRCDGHQLRAGVDGRLEGVAACALATSRGLRRSGSSTFGSMTANSSPPRRATTSCGRTECRSRPATDTSSASPTAWPSESLTTLKSSTSMKSTADRPVRPSRARCATRSMNSEPVREVGQRVVIGLMMELLLEARAASITACSSRSYCSATLALLASDLEQAQVLVAVAALDPEAVGEHDRADHPALAGEHRDHRVPDPALLEVCRAGAAGRTAARARRPGCSRVDRATASSSAAPRSASTIVDALLAGPVGRPQRRPVGAEEDDLRDLAAERLERAGEDALDRLRDLRASA